MYNNYTVGWGENSFIIKIKMVNSHTKETIKNESFLIWNDTVKTDNQGVLHYSMSYIIGDIRFDKKKRIKYEKYKYPEYIPIVYLQKDTTYLGGKKLNKYYYFLGNPFFEEYRKKEELYQDTLKRSIHWILYMDR